MNHCPLAPAPPRLDSHRMQTIDRRVWLAGAGALAVSGAATSATRAAAQANVMYDYLFLTLDGPRGTPPARAFAEKVRGRKAAVEAAGGQVLGLFTPQLGWVARQAALLVRWNADAKGRDHEMTALGRLDGVLNAERGELQATSRPAATDQA